MLRPTGGAIAPRFSGVGLPAQLGTKRVVGMGWQPDVPDRRDWTLRRDAVSSILARVAPDVLRAQPPRLPAKVDNREFCSQVEDQGQLGSCTANAVAGMMEYMMRRSHKSYVDVSRLFLYKATRKLLGWTGDTGAYLRSTMQAAAVFGVPPERYWPYEIGRFEDEPDAFLYAFASSYQALNYVRLDATGQNGADTLGKVKQMLAKGFVAVFGFPVYSSLVGSTPDIPYPTDSDSLVGGHAVLTVGYDDGRQVNGAPVPSLIIRNSWGESWGEAGYGYLPYRYVEDELAADFWTIFKEDWIDPAQFG